jgi:DnaK suppressor protein
MSSFLSDDQLAGLRDKLRDRRAELVEDIRQELLQSDNEHYTDLAERVHDVGEESVADLLSDLDLAVIDRHVEEIKDIEAAQQRIAMGSYGICIECGGEIDSKRLSAYPTAKRCYECQKRYEETHAGTSRPSL